MRPFWSLRGTFRSRGYQLELKLTRPEPRQHQNWNGFGRVATVRPRGKAARPSQPLHGLWRPLDAVWARRWWRRRHENEIEVAMEYFEVGLQKISTFLIILSRHFRIKFSVRKLQFFDRLLPNYLFLSHLGTLVKTLSSPSSLSLSLSLSLSHQIITCRKNLSPSPFSRERIMWEGIWCDVKAFLKNTFSSFGCYEILMNHNFT